MVDLSYVVMVKSTVEILQNFVASSEYMNFNKLKKNHVLGWIQEIQETLELCSVMQMINWESYSSPQWDEIIIAEPLLFHKRFF